MLLPMKDSFVSYINRHAKAALPLLLPKLVHKID